jgi:hypothetical protein
MTFDQWWDTTKTTATPETFAGWEHSCRQAWNAALAAQADAQPVALPRVPPLPFAVFDEHGRGADDRVQDYAAALVAAAHTQRQPLSAEQISDAVRDADLDWHHGWTLDETEPNRFMQFARAIERAHGIGEGE